MFSLFRHYFAFSLISFFADAIIFAIHFSLIIFAIIYADCHYDYLPCAAFAPRADPTPPLFFFFLSLLIILFSLFSPMADYAAFTPFRRRYCRIISRGITADSSCKRHGYCQDCRDAYTPQPSMRR